MALARASSLSVYRNLLRAVQGAFSGDAMMLSAAKEEIRGHMEVSRAVSDPAEIERLQGEGAEAASFLKTSIMQLKRQEGDGGKETYGLELSGDHDGGLVEPIVPGMELPK
jgi:complex III assembly factor LYRM7